MKAFLAAGWGLERARAAQFLRFAVVGAAGFLVDAGVLQLAVDVLGTNPIWGRLLSFAVAVLVTFELNRLWAFRDRGARRYGATLAAYLGVQGLGFACNFLIYMVLYLFLPSPYNTPLLCLAVASGVALLINYAGVSLMVFRAPKRMEDQP